MAGRAAAPTASPITRSSSSFLMAASSVPASTATRAHLKTRLATSTSTLTISSGCSRLAPFRGAACPKRQVFYPAHRVAPGVCQPRRRSTLDTAQPHWRSLYATQNFAGHRAALNGFGRLGLREPLLLLCLPGNRLRHAAAPPHSGKPLGRGCRNGRQTCAPRQRQLSILGRLQPPRRPHRFHRTFSHRQTSRRQLRPARDGQGNFFRMETQRCRRRRPQCKCNSAVDLFEGSFRGNKAARYPEVTEREAWPRRRTEENLIFRKEELHRRKSSVFQHLREFFQIFPRDVRNRPEAHPVAAPVHEIESLPRDASFRRIRALRRPDV